jgi:hypothetical protein
MWLKKNLRANFLVNGLLKMLGVDNGSDFPCAVGSPVWSHDLHFWLAGIQPKNFKYRYFIVRNDNLAFLLLNYLSCCADFKDFRSTYLPLSLDWLVLNGPGPLGPVEAEEVPCDDCLDCRACAAKYESPGEGGGSPPPGLPVAALFTVRPFGLNISWPGPPCEGGP